MVWILLCLCCVCLILLVCLRKFWWLILSLLVDLIALVSLFLGFVYVCFGFALYFDVAVGFCLIVDFIICGLLCLWWFTGDCFAVFKVFWYLRLWIILLVVLWFMPLSLVG